MAYLDVPRQQRMIEQLANQYRRGELSPGCQRCSPPDTRLWAPSPLPHTIYCDLEDLDTPPSCESYVGERLTNKSQAIITCPLCYVIKVTVRHYARLFDIDVTTHKVNIRYESDSERDIGQHDKTALITFGVSATGMTPITIRLSLLASSNPPAEFVRDQLSADVQTTLAKIRQWYKTPVNDEDTPYPQRHFPETLGINDPQALPTRILDVSGSTVKLCETQGLRGEYIALSHCWGNHPTITTGLATMESRKKGIRWEELGKTFQDAITVTRHLGKRYIWIDSLCILQDSLVDWEIESAKMATVYRNAFLTIAASKAADGSEGLFGERSYIWCHGGFTRELVSKYEIKDARSSSYVKVQHTDLWKPYAASSPVSRTFWAVLEPTHDVLVHRRRRSPHQILGLGMPLFTRAWFLQERLLSQRVLHFGAMETYREDERGLLCECLSGSGSRRAFVTRNQQNTARLLYSNLLRHTIPLLGSSTEATIPPTPGLADIEVWHELIEEYSRLLLTKEMDRLPALSGIANSLWPGYRAGIWTYQFPRGLYWTTDSSGGTQIYRPTQYRAPSFSWASVEGPINYHKWKSASDPHALSETGVGHVCAELIGEATEAEGLDPCGRVTNGHLELHAYIGIANVMKVTRSNCIIRSGHLEHCVKLDIPQENGEAEVQVGDEVTVILLECAKLPTGHPDGRWGSYKIFALVATPVPEKNQEYRRIGLVRPPTQDDNWDGLDDKSTMSMFTAGSAWFGKKCRVILR